MLKLEIEMQRQRRAEIRSLIPLDTRSINDEVIQDDENETPLNVAQNQSTFNAESSSPSPEKKRKNKKRWYKFFTRLIGGYHEKKPKPSSSKPITNPPPAAAVDSSTRRARYTSWAPGMTYEQYTQSKNELIESGMFALSNRNIARGFGGDRIASMIFLLPPSHEHEEAEEQQQQQQQQ